MTLVTLTNIRCEGCGASLSPTVEREWAEVEVRCDCGHVTHIHPSKLREREPPPPDVVRKKRPSGDAITELQRLGRRTASSKWHRENHDQSLACVARWRQNNPAKCLFSGMKKHARERGYGCAISLAEFEQLLEPMTCALTGWKLRWDGDIKQDPLAPSPDRIDNARGYEPGNVRVVAWCINKMRGAMLENEFLQACSAVTAGQSPLHDNVLGSALSECAAAFAGVSSHGRARDVVDALRTGRITVDAVTRAKLDRIMGRAG